MKENKEFTEHLYAIKGIIDDLIDDYEKMLKNPYQSYHDEYVNDLMSAMSCFIEKYYKIQDDNSV
ncbi:MAG: hypothetical protein IKI11_05545 [Neisseriaceae bacterium]|nr:hypothetical protein [Neisseriaceae bacterium]